MHIVMAGTAEPELVPSPLKSRHPDHQPSRVRTMRIRIFSLF